MRATTVIVTRRALLGAATAASVACAVAARAAGRTEIAYGSDPRQRLDVYERPGLKGAPILMFVHGGAWSFGDKSGVNSLPAFAERHGLLFASIGYRLSPQVDAGGSAQDVADAVSWMLQNGARFGGDPRRLYLMGHSAGAQLVALVGVDPIYLGAHRHAPADLAGVIPVDGAGYDASAQLDELKNHPMLRYAYVRAFKEKAAELSPTRRVAKGRAYPPFLLFYTDREGARIRAEELAGRLNGAGGRAAVYLAKGKTHMQVNRDMGVAGDPEGERVARFIATGAL